MTVIIDLTPVRDGTGLARLLEMLEGRSKKVFKDWVAGREHSWRGPGAGCRDGCIRCLKRTIAR